MDLIQILLKQFNSAHVVLVFDAQRNRLCISTRPFKLDWPWVSIYVVHQKTGSSEPHQPGTKSSKLSLAGKTNIRIVQK